MLHTTQNRLREKSFLHDRGFPVTPFRAVNDDGSLRQALAELKTPGVLKTAGFGYDGKGQTKILTSTDAPAMRGIAAGSADFVYEQFIDFDPPLGQGHFGEAAELVAEPVERAEHHLACFGVVDLLRRRLAAQRPPGHPSAPGAPPVQSRPGRLWRLAARPDSS